MKFLLYANAGQSEIETHLGMTDYRNEILLQAFAEVLVEVGEVARLNDPAEADALYAASHARGEDCVLLSFAAPQCTPIGSGSCPVVPVFAWGYPDIPEQVDEASWRSNPLNDWRQVFHYTGRAITTSSYACDAVQRSMGDRFPVATIPVPIKATDAAGKRRVVPASADSVALKINASVADSHRMGLNADSLIVVNNDDGTGFHPDDLARLPADSRQVSRSALVESSAVDITDGTGGEDETEWLVPLVCGWEPPASLPVRMRLKGVIYTSILTPSLERKNLHDMVSAFCWIFRDTEDATLVLKLAGPDLRWTHQQLLMLLSKLSPLKCRVIAISGDLSTDDYANLVAITNFYVNASLCEDLCLPLLDFLNEGIPAITPDHTAMADCIDEHFAFVVTSYPGEPTAWPHGNRDIARTTRYQLDWQSLAEAYRISHEVARHDSMRYQRMARRAAESVQAYCSPDMVKDQLRAFFCPQIPAGKSPPHDADVANAPSARVTS